MKNLQRISVLKQFQISTQLLTKINGGDKRATAKSDEEIE